LGGKGTTIPELRNPLVKGGQNVLRQKWKNKEKGEGFPYSKTQKGEGPTQIRASPKGVKQPAWWWGWGDRGKIREAKKGHPRGNQKLNIPNIVERDPLGCRLKDLGDNFIRKTSQTGSM